jgi:phosphoribosylanthranilate isomerase
MTRIKICGITTPADAVAAAESGADAIGLVFADSPRRVTIERAQEIVSFLPPLVTAVGVFVNDDSVRVAGVATALRLGAVQLHGNETPDACDQLRPLAVIKRFHVAEDDTPERLAERVRPYCVAAYLLDPGAGSGRTFQWELARGLPCRLMVSGGLTPGNVGEAVRLLRPYAVDVSSGVERSPGFKDRDRMRAFVAAVREADADQRT